MDIRKPKLQPTGDHIVVRVIKKHMSPGGVVIPENAQGDDTPIGIVVALGPGIMIKDGSFAPMVVGEADQRIQIGDRVLIKGGHRLVIDGDELHVATYLEVLGVLSGTGGN